MKKSSLIALFLLICPFVFSIDVTKFDKIYNAYKDQPLDVLNAAGEGFFNRNSLDSALVCFSIISGSYNPDLHMQNGRMYANAYNRCGAIYIQFNSYTKALNMFLKGLEVCEETRDEQFTSRIYNNIANLYYIFHDYKMADSYCKRAYQISVKYNDRKIQRTLLNNMIGINCYLEDSSKARENLSLLKKLKPDDDPAFNYNYCICEGALKLEEHNYAGAIEWFRKSIPFADYCPNRERMKYVAYSNIAKAFNYTHQYDSALVYLDKGKNLIQSPQNIDLRFESYNNYSDLYRKKGDEKLSLFYKRRHLEIVDSIFNAQEFGRIKDMQFLHEMDKIEKQVYRLNDAQILKDNQIKSQQLVLRIIFCAFIIIAVLLVIMFFQNRRLKDANVELFNKNLEIIRSEELEKESRKKSAESSAASGKPVEIDRESENSTDFAHLDNTKEKYQNSVISEEEKKRIRDAILEVMDNTEEYCSVDFNLEKMALLTNSKSKYVSQVINESYQKNFNVFVNEYRIKEARKRLMDINNYGNFTIASIATSVGFKSNANFNLVFKKVTGITPSMYQMMAKKRGQKQEEFLSDGD